MVPEGLGKCFFDLLADLCSDKSATKINLSLRFKNLPEISATDKITRSAPRLV